MTLYFTLIDQQEIAALERMPSGPQYLSTAVISRKFAQPFIRSPEERNERAADLYRAVRTTRYGCRRDGSHAAYSRRAFLVLHRRYGDTLWARLFRRLEALSYRFARVFDPARSCRSKPRFFRTD